MPNIIQLDFAVVGPNPRGLDVLRVLGETPGVRVHRFDTAPACLEVIQRSFILLDAETRVTHFRPQTAADPETPEIFKQSKGVYCIGYYAEAESIAPNIWVDASRLVGHPEAFEFLRKLPRIPMWQSALC